MGNGDSSGLDSSGEKGRKEGKKEGREGDDSFAAGRSDEETNCSFSLPDHSSRGRKLKRFLHGRIQV